MISAFDHTRKSLLGTITYDIPNKREYSSLSFDSIVILKLFDLGMLGISNLFFHFYLLNIDISLNIKVIDMNFLTWINNSHIFD